MIAARDSSVSRPTAQQITVIKDAGISGWCGYIATKSGVNLFSVWSRADFDIVRTLGMTPLAFCSGWDDPVTLKTLAAQWNVRLVLDVEAGIRGDGSWVDDFLRTSGAGLYGASSVHAHPAPFHIVAFYPGFDPKATWPASLVRPNTPCGWQWRGTHTEFSLSVDSQWLDDWFLSGGNVAVNIDPQDPVAINTGKLAYLFLGAADGAQAELTDRIRTTDDAVGRAIPSQIAQLSADVAKLSQPTVDVTALVAALTPALVTALINDPTFIPSVAAATVKLQGNKLSN